MVNYVPQPLVKNNRYLALYRLEIHGPDGNLTNGFTFPLTPSSVKKAYCAMGNYYDVATPIAKPGTGVLREVDVYGQSPPIYTVEGTTGYQAHQGAAGDANSFPGTAGVTGVDAAGILDRMFTFYAAKNAALIAAGDANLNTMRFLDYYRGDFWQIEPLGEQLYAQDNQRPLLINYRFRFVAVLNLAGALPPLDDGLVAAFIQPQQQVAIAVAQQLGEIITTYINATNLAGFVIP